MKPTSKAIYSNDRSAPRMRKGQFITTVVDKQLWQVFKKSNPEYKNMPWTTFLKKWSEIADTIRKESVVNPLGVKLGSYTGELKLQYLNFKSPGIDKKTSNEMGEKIGHAKLANKGKMGMVRWERRWAVKFNKMLQFFAFDETRDIKKLAKDHIDENPDLLRIARNTLGGFSIWRNTINTGFKNQG